MKITPRAPLRTRTEKHENIILDVSAQGSMTTATKITSVIS